MDIMNTCVRVPFAILVVGTDMIWTVCGALIITPNWWLPSSYYWRTRKLKTQTQLWISPDAYETLQVQSLEEKVKKVGSELECQRHNAQAAQLTWEQKVKEKDKEHKAELSQQNDLLRDMERQLDENRKRSEQEMNKVAHPAKLQFL